MDADPPAQGVKIARRITPGVVNIPCGLLEFRIWKQLGYPAHVDTSRKIYVHAEPVAERRWRLSNFKTSVSPT